MDPWSLDSEAIGFEKMERGNNARAIDFVKFGRLFLHNGIWDDVQVISADWIIKSTREDLGIDRSEYYDDFKVRNSLNVYNKYVWWGFPRDDGAYDFATFGILGQFIYVSPESNLIIVRNAEKSGIHSPEWFMLFETV